MRVDDGRRGRRRGDDKGRERRGGKKKKKRNSKRNSKRTRRVRVEEGEVNFKYGIALVTFWKPFLMYYYHKRLAPYRKWTNGEAGSSKQQATARRQSTDGGKETERTRVGARRTVSSPTY